MSDKFQDQVVLVDFYRKGDDSVETTMDSYDGISIYSTAGGSPPIFSRKQK